MNTADEVSNELRILLQTSLQAPGWHQGGHYSIRWLKRTFAVVLLPWTTWTQEDFLTFALLWHLSILIPLTWFCFWRHISFCWCLWGYACTLPSSHCPGPSRLLTFYSTKHSTLNHARLYLHQVDMEKAFFGAEAHSLLHHFSIAPFDPSIFFLLWSYS